MVHTAVAQMWARVDGGQRSTYWCLVRMVLCIMALSRMGAMLVPRPAKGGQQPRPSKPFCQNFTCNRFVQSMQARQQLAQQQQLPRQQTITLPIANHLKQRLLRAGYRTLADFEGIGSQQLATGVRVCVCEILEQEEDLFYHTSHNRS